MHWSVEHKNKVISGAVVLVVVISAALGGWYYLEQQDEKASVDFGKATQAMETPVRPAGMPAQQARVEAERLFGDVDRARATIGAAAEQHAYIGCRYWPVDLDNAIDVFGPPASGSCASYGTDATLLAPLPVCVATDGTFAGRCDQFFVCA